MVITIMALSQFLNIAYKETPEHQCNDAGDTNANVSVAFIQHCRVFFGVFPVHM